MDLRARYAKLRAVAEDQIGNPEGETAARLAAALLERFPDLQIPDAGERTSKRIPTRHRFDQVLLGRLAKFLGLETYRPGRRRPDGKGVRWADALELEGPAELVELAADSYADHRAHLDDLLFAVAVGYAQGAFPPSSDELADAADLPDHALGAALAALEAGRQRSPRAPESRQLGGPGLLDG